MIIINDASADHTSEIIKSFDDSRIRVIDNQFNNGLTKNLNMALELAGGEYIVRMDGDDIAFLGRIKKQVEYMDANPDVAISGGSIINIGDIYGVVDYSTEDELIRFK